MTSDKTWIDISASRDKHWILSPKIELWITRCRRMTLHNREIKMLSSGHQNVFLFLG